MNSEAKRILIVRSSSRQAAVRYQDDPPAMKTSRARGRALAGGSNDDGVHDRVFSPCVAITPMPPTVLMH
jgi:hypothetical protein